MYEGERFNSITHLVGVALSLIGASVLITLAGVTHDPWKIVSCSVYGALMVALFFFSTMYHSLQGPAKGFFQRMDYMAIYLMIAGTYTPFTLVNLRLMNGWWMFGIIWGLALIGILFEAFKKTETKRYYELVVYVLMGWLILFFIQETWRALSAAALFWLVLGGVLYTLGVLFFVNDHRWKHAHGIWHLFVLCGCACHYVSVMLSVLFQD